MGGNIAGGNFPEGSLMGGNFPAGSFPDTVGKFSLFKVYLFKLKRLLK